MLDASTHLSFRLKIPIVRSKILHSTLNVSDRSSERPTVWITRSRHSGRELGGPAAPGFGRGLEGGTGRCPIVPRTSRRRWLTREGLAYFR